MQLTMSDIDIGFFLWGNKVELIVNFISKKISPSKLELFEKILLTIERNRSILTKTHINLVNRYE